MSENTDPSKLTPSGSAPNPKTARKRQSKSPTGSPPDAPIKAAGIGALGVVVGALIAGPLMWWLSHISLGKTAEQAVKEALDSHETKTELQFIAGKKLDDKLGLVPGEIRAFAFGSTPKDSAIQDLRRRGWLECAGQALAKKDFALLYEVLSTAGFPWGKTDVGGIIHARVPDLRGVFLRGWMHGRSTKELGDPDVDKRSAPDADGTGANGNSVGSFQPDQLHDHEHTFQRGAHNNDHNLTTPLSAGADGAGIPVETTSPVVGASSGSETRPRNVYVMYCIYTGITIPDEVADGSFSK